MKLFGFLRKRAENNFMECPRCCSGMSASISRIDGTDKYREIHRTYKCKECDMEYSSLELVAPLNEIPSLFGSVSQLCASLADFTSALKSLNSLKPAYKKGPTPSMPDVTSMN